MRVLHVLNGTSGGSTVSALELVKASRTAETGIEHCAVYPGQLGVEDPEIQRVFHRARPIPLPAWNSPKNLDAKRRLALYLLFQRESGLGIRTARALRQVIEEWSVDLVTTNCAVNIHGALAARRAGIPHVWHIRERIGTGGSMQFRLDDRRLVHRIAELSSRIAAVSEYVAEPFRKYGADGMLEVVYDGIDVAAFEDTETRGRVQRLRRGWGIPDEAVLVGMVANVTAHVKQHDLFLRAAAQVAGRRQDVWFVVVGALPTRASWFNRSALERLRRLGTLAGDLGLASRLVWAGFVDDPPAVMNAIDILAHACAIEGLGRVLLEAMASGTPVVGPAAGGLPEGVGAAGVLVEADSPGCLAQGMESLLASDGERERFSNEGRRRVMTYFASKTHAAVMADLYRAACGRRPRDMARVESAAGGMSLSASDREPPQTQGRFN